MKITIKAKTGYRVRKCTHRETGETWAKLFDGEDLIMIAKFISKAELQNETRDNEAFHICEVFLTAKGNKFVYARDEEVDEDFLCKVEEADE